MRPHVNRIPLKRKKARSVQKIYLTILSIKEICETKTTFDISTPMDCCKISISIANILHQLVTVKETGINCNGVTSLLRCTKLLELSLEIPLQAQCDQAFSLYFQTSIDGFGQDCSISSPLAMEILQSCTKLSI